MQRKGHLLALYPRSSAVTLGAIVLALIAASLLSGTAEGLPGVALGWRFGLEIVRAALVFAVLAVVAMVLVRGWVGEWPRSVSTSGLDYSEAIEASEAARALDEAEAILDHVQPIIESARKGG